MVEFLYEPFLPGNLRPKYLKIGGVYPLFYNVLNATGGGPSWTSGEAPCQGVQPFAVAQGASHLAF